ncbi:MAG TPA: hypothetical protein VIU40_04825 [Geobacteraceae bacterium]
MKRIEAMNRAKFVKQGSKMVFVFDLSSLDPDDVHAVMMRGEDVIRRMPQKSVLTLANIRDNERYDILREYTKHFVENYGSQVAKMAVSGIADNRVREEWSDMLSSLVEDLELFDNVDDAVSWLIDSQAA